MSYADAQKHAIKKFVDGRRMQFNKDLKALMSKACPAHYDNPLGTFPVGWDEVLGQMSEVYAENMRTRAENHLTSKMAKSMVEELESGVE